MRLAKRYLELGDIESAREVCGEIDDPWLHTMLLVQLAHQHSQPEVQNQYLDKVDEFVDAQSAVVDQMLEERNDSQRHHELALLLCRLFPARYRDAVLLWFNAPGLENQRGALLLVLVTQGSEAQQAQDLQAIERLIDQVHWTSNAQRRAGLVAVIDRLSRDALWGVAKGALEIQTSRSHALGKIEEVLPFLIQLFGSKIVDPIIVEIDDVGRWLP